MNVTQLRPRPCAAEHFSSCVRIAERNLSAKASHLENTCHAYSARSTTPVTERANEKTDEELYRLCEIADDADKACTKQRWIAQHTLRRS